MIIINQSFIHQPAIPLIILILILLILIGYIQQTNTDCTMNANGQSL